jgi:hypothetical protein
MVRLWIATQLYLACICHAGIAGIKKAQVTETWAFFE